ncbi:hypothetical protein NEOKW01_0058 [Nematocida sp. AWRm80]|nr:hypothetical protein NEOKW01_0058 [Nematocida sp. AWRm80]
MNLLVIYLFYIGCIVCKSISIGVFSGYSSDNSDITEYTRNLITELARAGSKQCKVVVYAVSKSHREPPVNRLKGVKMKHFVLESAQEQKTLQEIAAEINMQAHDYLLLQYRYGILHNHELYESFLGSIKQRTKTIAIIHSALLFPAEYHRVKTQKLAIATDYIIAVGQKTKYSLIHHYGLPGDMIIPLSLGVKGNTSKNRFSQYLSRYKGIYPIERDIETSSEPKTRILVLGNPIGEQELLQLVEAMNANGRKEILDSLFIQVVGTKETNTSYNTVLDKISEYQLEKYISWEQTDPTPTRLREALYRASDILLVLKPNTPGLQTQILQAMYHGLLVATVPTYETHEYLGLPLSIPENSNSTLKNGQPVKQIKHARRGIVFSNSSTEALAKILRQLVYKREKMQEIAKKGSEYASKLKWSTVTKSLLYFLRTEALPKRLVPDPCKKHLFFSKGKWHKDKAVLFDGRLLPSIQNGAYNLYTDPYLVINARVHNNTLKEVGIRTIAYSTAQREPIGEESFVFVTSSTRLPKLKSISLSSKLNKNTYILAPSMQYSIIKKKNTTYIFTPNVLFRVGVLDDNSVYLRFYRISRFIFAKGLLGTSALRMFSFGHKREKYSPEIWRLPNWKENIFSISSNPNQFSLQKGQLYGLPYTVKRKITRISPFSTVFYMTTMKKILKDNRTGNITRTALFNYWTNRRVHIKISKYTVSRNIKKEPLEIYIIKQLIAEGLEKNKTATIQHIQHPTSNSILSQPEDTSRDSLKKVEITVEDKDLPEKEVQDNTVIDEQASQTQSMITSYSTSSNSTLVSIL